MDELIYFKFVYKILFSLYLQKGKNSERLNKKLEERAL